MQVSIQRNRRYGGIYEQRLHIIAPVLCDGLNEPNASLKTMLILGQKGVHESFRDLQ